jgi:hypothetical protein
MRTSWRSCSAVGGVRVTSTERKASFLAFRKSTDFLHVDHVGFW